MKDVQMKIAEILREEDIEGFVEHGAPGDEYDTEAEMIAASISSMDVADRTLENIIFGVLDIWQESFDLSLEDLDRRRPNIQKLCKRLAGL